MHLQVFHGLYFVPAFDSVRVEAASSENQTPAKHQWLNVPHAIG
jgi:hypothetical protein